MTDQVVFSIASATVALMSATVILIKFVINSVFKSLQMQIDGLKADAEKREAEIAALRESDKEWARKYYALETKHTILQRDHELLQRKFDLMVKKQQG